MESNTPPTPQTAQTRFSTLNKENRSLAKKYINGTAWCFQNMGRNDERSKYIQGRVKEFHSKLLEVGLNEEDLKILRMKAKKFINTPPEEMSFEQFVLLAKLVFL